MPRSQVTDAGRRAFPYAAAAMAAAAVGLLLGRGGLGLLIAGAVAAGLVLVLLVQSLGFQALILWVVVGVIAYPFVRYPQQHSELTFDRLLILGLAGALVITSSRRARSPASTRLTAAIVVLTIAFVVRAALTSHHQRYEIELVLDTVVLPAILYAGARRYVSTVADWDRLAGAFAAAGALLGAIATAERLIGFQLATRFGGEVTLQPGLGIRESGPYGTDDVLAVALLVCFAATLLWVQTSPRKRIASGALVVALELAGIAFTLFRGAWIAALVVLVVALGLRPRRYARLLGTTALIGLVAAVLLLRAQDSGALAQRINDPQNLNGRAATYSQAFDLFARHPLAGVGLNQFGAAQTNELIAKTVNGVGAVSSPHSSYFDALSEGGLLLFIPLAAVTFASVSVIHRYRKLGASRHYDVLVGAAVAAAGLGYLLMSLEETVIISSTESNAFLAILLGACASRLDVLENTRASRA
jgi:O-antigen ligase